MTPDPRLDNLQRAAELPWTDGGRWAVREASQPWPVLVERCFQALDHDRIRLKDPTGRCAIASAEAAVMAIGICAVTAPEIVVGAVIGIGVVVVAVVIKEALDDYEMKRGRIEARRMPATTPFPEAPLAKRWPKPEPRGPNFPPPPRDPPDRDRPKCEAIPVPHRGGDQAHNECADNFPPNRYPGKDVQVAGKRFDSLQVGKPVLWEIKTDQFDTYSDFLRKQVIDNQVKELDEERRIAAACGYDFMVGVSSAAHKAAALLQNDKLVIVVTGCPR